MWMADSPCYDLKSVFIATLNDDIILSRKAQKDLRNLGYSRDNLISCLQSLKLSDFKHCKIYLPNPFPHDVYVTRFYRSPEDNYDDIYTKFFMTHNNIFIELMSFHLSA